MKKLLMDISTIKDGLTFDSGRVLGNLTIIVMLGLSIADFCVNHHFDFEKFGICVGATFAGVGALLKLKENTEPDK